MRENVFRFGLPSFQSSSHRYLNLIIQYDKPGSQNFKTKVSLDTHLYIFSPGRISMIGAFSVVHKDRV